MNRQDDPYREIDRAEREQRRQERREKWKKREKSFWKTFLFTEDGKPKSGLLVYTFCLSFLFLGVYIGAFYLTISALTVPLAALPPVLGNLIQSVLAGAIGAGVGVLLHVLLPDKRLILGTHLWLALYIVASGIALCLMLREWGAIWAMLTFALWFALIPIGVGTLVAFLLYRRDHRSSQPEERPEWRKYTDRR